jgi:Outer membrane lipoprotein-sorting protein
MWVLAQMRPAVLLVATVVAAPLVSFAQSGTLNLDQIVSRMEQARAADRAQNVGYTVTREYQLAPLGASKPSSEVVAEVSFVPPAEKQYTIVKSEGNDRGEGIVRRILDRETVMASHWQPHDISSANYDFALLGRGMIDGHDCFVLQLSPKRDAVELVRGKAWIDAHDFEIRRIEGETAKSPSFWIKKVNVTLNYSMVNGIWLETSTQAVADVRVAGTHVLTSRELDVRAATMNARASKPKQTRRRAPNIAADTAVWVPR